MTSHTQLLLRRARFLHLIERDSLPCLVGNYHDPWGLGGGNYVIATKVCICRSTSQSRRHLKNEMPHSTVRYIKSALLFSSLARESTSKKYLQASSTPGLSAAGTAGSLMSSRRSAQRSANPAVGPWRLLSSDDKEGHMLFFCIVGIY